MSKLVWYLEEVIAGNTVSSTAIVSDVFIIGRHNDCDFRIKDNDVSRRHAEIFSKDGTFYVRDLDSVNGTFVNREQVDYVVKLNHMDVLHIAQKEFRVICKDIEANALPEATAISGEDITIMRTSPPGKMATSYAKHMLELLAAEKLKVSYRPILNVSNLRTVAYEAVGHGTYPSLPSAMPTLFFIAENINKAPALSEMLRTLATTSIPDSSERRRLFLDLHPTETQVKQIVNSFKVLQRRNAQIDFVLQVSEKSIGDMDFIKKLHQGLSDLGVAIAYVDFGAGHGRLVELMTHPPEYLKFAPNLMTGIYEKTDEEQYLIQALVDVANKFNITTIAAGVSSKKEAAVCRNLGFDWVQNIPS